MRDEKQYSQLYSMTAVVGHEDAVDKMDLAEFCHLYAFDVMGQITLDAALGMMESNMDKTRILMIVSQFTTYAVQMGLVPELHAPSFPLSLSWDRRQPAS
ncbi:hypothetical protein HRG_007627 [Hirsutella rhossiliensis]|uniref:Uncharacterized protein n=1 Tax=Hirsutella rhossiliensis TaxID=111463 RepID=A0A9P8SGX5_9HYPO|nr:uncharacterized protein HRG_07627 [Hirsutella rhossiliensis]KAH0961549.1 hypothetical protein HRG_07627 [Hirsutella rhossiliensis]